MDEHLDHLSFVFDKLRGYRLMPRIEKCSFCQDNVELLGHIVSKDGVRTDPKKIEAVRMEHIPRDPSAIRSFLGLAGYYRRFINNFANISSGLHNLTSAKVKFSWTPESQSAFDTLKFMLCSAPVLSFPDFNRPFTVETDASSSAVGDVLAQRSDGKLHHLQYASRSLNSAEKNFSSCKREALPVIFALKKFRVYILSSEPFEQVTDHQALQYAFRKKDVHGRLARWIDFLEDYELKIMYKSGADNRAEDFLPRHALAESAPEMGADDDHLALVALEATLDLEFPLLDIKRYLLGQEIKVSDVRLRRNVRRTAKSFLTWNGELFRRTGLEPKIVVSRYLRTQILTMMHDKIGHWNPEKTSQFAVERYWWPEVTAEVFAHVKSCKGCQRAAPIPKYRTSLRMPITGLFYSFSIDFATPLPPGSGGECYLLVAVNHLTSWPLTRATITDTTEVVVKFVEEEIIRPFGPPRTIVSDNAKAFTEKLVEDLMQKWGIR